MPQLQTKRKEQADILQRAGEYLMRGLETARSGFVTGQRAQEALGQGQLEQTGKVLGTGVNRVETARQLTNVMDKWSRGEATPEEKKGIIESYMRHAALVGGGTVYVGSPREWTPSKTGELRPDPSYIGTGEGGAAYGHGLYFAENPQTAKTYVRDTMSVRGQPYYLGVKDDNAKNFLLNARGNIDDAIKIAQSYVKDFSPGGATPRYSQVPIAQKALDELQLLKAERQVSVKSGSMYRADIPDEHIAKMLDWDKPLSEQAPNVKAVIPDILKQAAKSFPQANYALRDVMADNTVMTGRQLYEAYAGHRASPQAASEGLAKLGIPGIKYLDQGSRQAGQGTRNFVVFDPEIVGKVEKVQ